MVKVCSNLAAKTMRKGRNHPRNYAIEELQADQAGAIMCPDTFSCSPLQLGGADAARLSRRGDNGHDDWFSAALWRPAAPVSAGSWSDARRTGSSGGAECARPELSGAASSLGPKPRAPPLA